MRVSKGRLSHKCRGSQSVLQGQSLWIKFSVYELVRGRSRKLLCHQIVHTAQLMRPLVNCRGQLKSHQKGHRLADEAFG